MIRPFAPVAQLDRVPDYESGGRTFESYRARHIQKSLIHWMGLFCIRLTQPILQVLRGELKPFSSSLIPTELLVTIRFVKKRVFRTSRLYLAQIRCH